MNSHFSHRQSNPRWPWLIASALALGGILFLPLYLTRVMEILLQAFDAGMPEALAILLAVLYGIPQILPFSHPVPAVLVTWLSIGLLITTLLVGRPGRLTQFLLTLTLLATLTSPFFAPYRPAVEAAPGCEMWWPTQPGVLEGVVKRAQAFAEVRSCEYTLLGWSADGVLYYREVCKDQPPQGWAYPVPGRRKVDDGSSPQRVATPPTDLIRTDVPRHSILERVRSPRVFPSEMEPQTRRLQVRGDDLASPDGQRVAVVVRHIYGPEDVIVLSQGGRGEQ